MSISARRTSSRQLFYAHRLEARGFHLAEQVLTPEATARASRDEAFRRDLIPIRDLLRPHAFASRASRDAACRQPMLGGMFALRPISADELGSDLDPDRLIAVGPRVDDPDFQAVASAVADPEIEALCERCSEDRRGGPAARSVVLTVFGAHYQLSIDDEQHAEVRGKVPFDALPDDEVKATAAWLCSRLWNRQCAM